MDRTERFYKIDQLLQERQAVPLEAIIEAHGVSRATVVRDLEYLRDRLAAPIVWDRAQRGYRYDSSTFPAVPYYLAKAAVMGGMRLLGRRSHAGRHFRTDADAADDGRDRAPA